MGTKAWRAEDFMGLTPAVDPRRSEKFFALNGLNYLWDATGPKSAFGNRWLTPYTIGRPEHTQGFRVRLKTGTRDFIMTGDSILEWDEILGGFKVLYVTPVTNVTAARWTVGYLNGYVYFCHPVTGILVMNVTTNLVLPLTSDGAPTNAIAIVVNNGRLCAITPDLFTFSAPSNGLDWVPRIAGPGFQVISDRVAGDPIMITSYTGGCLTWTSGGVMQSAFSADQLVYKHKALNTQYRPVNSFCTIQIDDNNVVILDRRGLFQTRGDAPTPYAPMFNEFLIEYIKDNKLNEGQNLRIEWDDLRRQVYLSVSLSIENPLYESCFVYYPPVDKWGQFNESHYGILPLLIESTERADDYFGFVGADARVRYWTKTGSREILPTDSTLDCVYPVIQKPAHNHPTEAVVILSSSMQFNTRPIGGLVPAGYFPYDGETPFPPNLTGLAARIQLGLLRVDQDAALDMMTEVTQVLIGSLISGDPDKVSVNYNLIPAGTSDEDYNLEAGTEDFGVNEVNYTNHKLRIVSTVDGLSEFQSAIPKLVQFLKGARYFACSTSGIWHILELEAIDVGEAFHLRSFELTVAGAGRYS